jgi:hypothetical protein
MTQSPTGLNKKMKLSKNLHRETQRNHRGTQRIKTSILLIHLRWKRDTEKTHTQRIKESILLIPPWRERDTEKTRRKTKK